MSFSTSDGDLETRALGDDSSFVDTIQPIQIPEIFDPSAGAAAVSTIQINEEILNAFQDQGQASVRLHSIWNSQNTSSRVQVSIWAPTLDTGWTGASRTRILLGHYATRGFNSPTRLKSTEKLKYQTIELTDVATLRMKRNQTLQAVLAAVFPHPVRFKLSWHMKRGANSVFAWRAIAPQNFVSMGMVFTKSDAEPDVTIMRCVPSNWTAPSSKPPQKVWDDTGSGGGKAGSMWIVNDMNMLVLIPGHEPHLPRIVKSSAQINCIFKVMY